MAMLALFTITLENLKMHEKDPQPKSLDHVDVLATLKSGTFFDKLAHANNDLQNNISKDEELEHIVTLEESFGEEHFNGSARFIAELHQSDIETGLLMDGEYCGVDDLKYVGIVKNVIGDRPVFVCEFHDQATDDYSYVDPRTFIELAIAEDEGMIETVQQRLVECTASSIAVLHSDDFLRSSRETQQKRINDLTNDIDKDMHMLFGDLRVDVDCKSYYRFTDNDTHFDLDKAFTDQSEILYEERFTPSGVIVGSTLLEQIEMPFHEHNRDGRDTFTSKESYYRSGGIPCLIIRDPLNNELYFVQLNATRSISCEPPMDGDEEENHVDEA